MKVFLKVVVGTLAALCLLCMMWSAFTVGEMAQRRDDTLLMQRAYDYKCNSYAEERR